MATSLITPTGRACPLVFYFRSPALFNSERSQTAATKAPKSADSTMTSPQNVHCTGSRGFMKYDPGMIIGAFLPKLIPN